MIPIMPVEVMTQFLTRVAEFAEKMAKEDEYAGLGDTPTAAMARRLSGDAWGLCQQIRNDGVFIPPQHRPDAQAAIARAKMPASEQPADATSAEEPQGLRRNR
tara:strand:+ start:233 stop:541 length:309 start_codon:yes stop_codon:yes gene_type:complete